MVKKLLLYGVLSLVVPLAMLEGLFRLLPVSSPPDLLPVSAEDPVTRFRPNVEYAYSSGPDFAIRTRKRSNNFGYAHIADYQPQERTPLLMVIGDSFVEAQAVNAGKSAAEILHAALDGRGRVYSIGVAGAPLSQYLVFAQYAQRTFRPDAMAFFIISNDFDESLLKYKAEARFHYFDERGALRRVDYALSSAKQVLRHSAFLRYVMYNLVAEHRLQSLFKRAGQPADPNLGFRDLDPPEKLESRICDSEHAVELFFERLPAMSGLEPGAVAFVLDAVRPAIYADTDLLRSENTYHARMRRYFAARARARGYLVLDLQPAFIRRHRQDKARFEFPTDSHWNELGNRVVAEEIARSPVFARLLRAPNELAAPADGADGKF